MGQAKHLVAVVIAETRILARVFDVILRFGYGGLRVRQEFAEFEWSTAGKALRDIARSASGGVADLDRELIVA